MPDASWGYSAKEGLEAVLGGKNIDKIKRQEGAMSPEEMRKYIMEAPEKKNISYSDESRRFAKAILIEADKAKEKFLSSSHDFADEVLHKGDYDLSGFMFGWAANAVRYVLGEHPINNPAIIEIEVK